MSKFGVVLSSGGSRGVFAHTGFMSALSDLNICVSASSGCSAGAVVGAVLASGADLDAWKSAITQVRTEQFWTPRSMWRLFYSLAFRKGRGFSGLSETATAIQFLEKHLRVGNFEDCTYPFSAIAVNLDTVEKKIFHEGPLAPAVMASAAMPGFYDPVEIGEQHFSDGAVFDLAPAEAICCRYHLDVLLVHHVAQQNFTPEGLQVALKQPWTIVNLMHRLIFRRRPWYATGQPIAVHRCSCGCKAAVVVVEPELPDLAWPLAEGGEKVLEAAHTHAMTHLTPILEALQDEPRTLLN